MIIKKIDSPNYDKIVIDVEYIVLHYSALSTEAVIKLFSDKSSKVSAHFLIDQAGIIYQLVAAIEGVALRAWHAGKSFWFDGQKKWQNFNDFAIGIELINLNGNIFDYTEKQYLALSHLVTELKQIYPKLRDPTRVIGHEQIAGFRGKLDPGLNFQWSKFFKLAFDSEDPPKRDSVLKQFATIKKSDKSTAIDEVWAKFSNFLETQIKSCL